MTPLQAIDALARLLHEENEALRAGDVTRAAWFAAEKDTAVARLAEAEPEIAELRRGAGRRSVDERLAALRTLLRRNEHLIAHAADAARDLIAVLDARDGRVGGYDARGTRTHAARSGTVLNESI